MGQNFDIQLYNSLTRKKEVFQPLDEKNVRMYVCGPTVYDYAHIGNARPVIVFDVLYRLLRYKYGENHVTYVRNITDVDDKINQRAAERGISIRELTTGTEAQFQKDMDALGCLRPNEQPRATEHITEMVEMIETLVARGHAYVAEDHVLFDVTSMPAYGQLSGRTLEDNQAGARVEVESYKKNPGDFVLWKPSKEGEPSWPSPCGISVSGRPGWHIECSAMSKKHLGEVFDIHGGGVDLKFPHHENEIAQSCCAHGTDKMASVWMHNGFLMVEGQKMSKSLGNFITVHDLLETENFGGRKWPGEVIRLAMLMTHYREPIDFSVARLEEAEAKLRKWAEITYALNISEWSLQDVSFADISDDLNISKFVFHLDTLAKQAKEGSKPSAKSLKLALVYFGFENIDSFAPQSANEIAASDKDMLAKIDAMVSDRLSHIINKNWAEADRIRDELLAQGIQLKDGKDPETGERITTWEVKR